MSTTLTAQPLTLTAGQEAAMHAFTQFLLDPAEQVLVLSGYAGTGKTTLVSHLLAELPNIQKTARLINPKAVKYKVVLTATTNKAAENLMQLAGAHCVTIHSHLGLRVNTDYQTGETKLTPRKGKPQEDELIFIDEASYIDSQLLKWIFKLSSNCKIVFMGDPAQLSPVKSTNTPVFHFGFPEVTLTEVVRQAEGNPIMELATAFRNTVITGDFFSFVPDGVAVQHLVRENFEDAILADMSRPEWNYHTSKILAWTNRTVIGFNHAVRDSVKGSPDFAVDDYAICNNYVQIGRDRIKTDQMVKITEISPPTQNYGVGGRFYTLDRSLQAFMADSLGAMKDRLRQAKVDNDLEVSQTIQDEWIDLRAAYACTINKSQGSTFDAVYIDLDDIRRCNSGNQIARMLYVAVSRARHKVIFTGDLVS